MTSKAIAIPELVRRFAIDVIYPAASAAYTIMNVPNPALPTGYTMVGPIEADPQQAAPVMAQTDSNRHRMVHGMLSESNIFGLVAWNASESTAIISFRGTKTVAEWVADVDAVPVPYLPVKGAGLVHMGFQLVYEHVRRSVPPLLNQCTGAKRVLITGHSLGSALAVLGGFDIGKNSPLKVIPELYTWAGPRTGAPDFAGNFGALITTCYRVVNFMDVVPQVPLPPLYQHVGNEVLVHGGFRPLDITYAHHLTTYLAGLQRLQP
ncbi:MAG: lipase family protein [Acidobacteria bacterium]|nr:lipase family protein [Acidobacteriota bacterium]